MPILPANSGTRQTLWTRRFVYTLLTVFGCFWGYLTLLIVLPLEVADQGGSSTVVGLGTGLFMVAAVLAQFSTPRLLARYRIRTLLFLSLLLLGITSLLQPMTDSVAVTFGLNLMRGVGIGIGSVVGATGVSILSARQARGSAGLVRPHDHGTGRGWSGDRLGPSAGVLVCWGLHWAWPHDPSGLRGSVAPRVPFGTRGWEAKRDHRGLSTASHAAAFSDLRRYDRRVR